jgi:predicted nucleic acid-binding protein
MRIFWDTNLFVYLWALIHWQHQHEAELVTSTLTIGELLVHPLRQDREDLADRYLGKLFTIARDPVRSVGGICLCVTPCPICATLRRMQFS